MRGATGLCNSPKISRKSSISEYGAALEQLAAKNMAGELWLIYVVRTNLLSMLKNKSAVRPCAAKVCAKTGAKGFELD